MKKEEIIELIMHILFLVAIGFTILISITGCSETETYEPIPKSEPYHFVNHYQVWNGQTYDLATVCPSNMNDVYITTGNWITITSDCALTDGFYQTQFGDNMTFTTDEIVCLGDAILLAWPKDIEITICNANSVQLVHTRQSDGSMFIANYER